MFEEVKKRMGESTVFERLKEFIAGVAFTVFLWASGMTQDEYWDAIYVQEKKQEGTKK